MRAAAASALAALALGAGCGTDDRPEPPERRTIDERAGTYRGVGIGDSRGDVRREFGPLKPDQGAGGYLPLGEEDYYGPNVISTPRPCGGPKLTEQLMRYRSVVFTTCRGRVHDLIVTDEGAATRRGVGPGDPLDDAREAYAGLDCDTAGGGEYEEYDYCAGRLGALHVWFGHDPIRSVTLADRPFR